MEIYIVNAFFYKFTQTVEPIFLYINKFVNKPSRKLFDNNIKYLVKTGVLIRNAEEYSLSIKGKAVLQNQIYYYKKIIYRFMCSLQIKDKRYNLIEKREEQALLRQYLLDNRPLECILCDKNLPKCLLETAHLKPRCILGNRDRYNYHVVELMCLYCHKLYDTGLISVDNGNITVSSKIERFELIKTKEILRYNDRNKVYFDFHYKNIYIA